MKNSLFTGRFAFLLTLVAFSLWIISVFQASPQNMGELGLISTLPITFFAAVILLTVSFLIAVKNPQNQKLLFLQIVILVCFLSLTPTLVEGVRGRYSFPTYGFMDYIVRNGQLNPSLVWYHNWPGVLIVFSNLTLLGGVSPQTLINSCPIVPELLYILPVMLFSSFLIKNVERKWIMVWSFFIVAWTGQDFLNSQALEFFIYLLLLSVVIVQANGNKKLSKDRTFLILFLLLFFAVIIGHFLTSLMIAGIITSLFVFKRLKRINIVAVSLVLVIVWTIYGATSYFNSDIAQFVSEALRFDLIFNGNLAQRTTGSFGHILTVYDRIIFTLISVGLAFSGLLLSRRANKRSEEDKTVLIVLLSILLFAFIFPYGGELFLRLLLFSSILLAYFISKNVDSKKTYSLLVIFLLAAPFMHVIATYGDEQFDYVSAGESTGAAFFRSHVSNGFVMGGSTWANYLGSYDHYLTVSLIYGNLSETQAITAMQRINLNKQWPIYLMLTTGDEAYFSLYNNDSAFVGKTEVEVQNNTHYNLFYSNPNMQLYSYNPNR
jgi:hypothetical protein